MAEPKQSYVQIHAAARCCGWFCETEPNISVVRSRDNWVHHDGEKVCEGHGSEIGVLGGADRSDIPNVPINASTPEGCMRACSASPRCRHLSHSATEQRCVFCSSCELSTVRHGAVFTSWTKRAGGFGRFERSELVTSKLLLPLLQNAYSEELYGAAGRIPLESLRLVWLSLLQPSALAAIASAAGICKWESKPPANPFYSVVDMIVNPPNAMWIRPDHGHVPATILPNHSWVEVVHCPNKKDNRRRLAWKFAPMWFWYAPGSGVSINLGRTMIMRTWTEAANFLNARFRGRFKSGRRGCDEPRAMDRVDLPDSIQILNPRYEYYSREPKHEILWLKRSECGTLSHSSPNVRCGRSPHLFPCKPNSSALRQMSECQPAGRPAFSPWVRNALGGGTGQLHRFRPSSPCGGSPCHRAVDSSEWYCPQRQQAAGRS
jgi:hypothetical protein